MTRKRHIMIAEDEKQTLLSLSLILKGAGYVVTKVENGLDALEKLAAAEAGKAPVDLLLTDINMPGASGLELVQQLNRRNIDVPVIAMTGFGNKDVVVQLLKGGCKDYIEKPFSGEELLECVENTLVSCRAAAEEKSGRRHDADEDDAKLVRDISTYKLNLERLSAQFDSAVDIYHELVDVPDRAYRIPLAWKNRPLAELGGDFIGVESRENAYDILIADVAGHDLGSSFHTILIKAFFEENSRKVNDGPTLFHMLNRHLLESGKNERMITALFLRIDLETMTCDMAAAGHPPLIHLQQTADRPRRLSTEGTVLGIYAAAEFESIQFGIAPGDRLFMHTDGVTGAARFDPSDGRMKSLSEKGLEEFMLAHRSIPLEEMVSRVWADVLDYCEYKPGDDMLLMGVEIPKEPVPETA